ncbi:MAG: DUF2950 domain-containing protein [Planctomycetes bacterium]|nr:DUF2950 domain-containing protein [Planctomycetota bacterium]
MNRGHERGTRHALRSMATAIVSALLLGGCATDVTSSSGRHFETPDEAVETLLVTLRADDPAGLAEIFGTEHPEVYETSDAAADTRARRTFLAEADERLELEDVDSGTVQILLGDQAWPLPVPLVREFSGWRFDAAAGAEEMINRRVGRNEIWAIEICDAIGPAQAYFRDKDVDGNGIANYARRFNATAGKRDGLYWPARAGEPPSPLHDFVTSRQDYLSERQAGSPVRGYLAKLLTRQGPSAPGGAIDYLDGDQLLRGYALVLWPAEYDRTGVMTFITSHHAMVYERDLGEDSADIAAAMIDFDPDEMWRAVE